MIAAGTVEEKMYEKQIHKDGIRRAVFSTGAPVERYFEKSHLRQLLKLAPKGVCETMKQAQPVVTDLTRYLGDGVIGVSRHDVFYQLADAEGNSEPQWPSTPALKVQGRTSRILHESNILDFVPLGKREVKARSCTPFASSSTGENSKPPSNSLVDADVRILKSDENHSTSYAEGACVFNVDDDEELEHSVAELSDLVYAPSLAASRSIAEIMHESDRAVEAGMPKMALQLLMDVLENRIDEMDRFEKVAFHKQLALLLGPLGLLDSIE
jgi:hypothetical protein